MEPTDPPSSKVNKCRHYNDMFGNQVDIVDYSSGDSINDDENRLSLRNMNSNERSAYLLELWKMAYLKGYGASLIMRVFTQIH